MDIFDKFERKMSRLWDIFDDDFRDIGNISKIGIMDNKNENNFHSVSYHQEFGNSEDGEYSMSYRYETGMKEPEILINGNPSQKNIDSFLEGLKAHHSQQLKNSDLKKLTAKKSELSSMEFSLEMPGLGKEDIKTKIEGKRVYINGEKGKLKYSKVIKTPFKIAKIEITADNGLITIIAKS